ncbi:MAG TPA: CDP-alcohol phosphatidyltransferase family protein [Caulobacteraceae bacterium]
MTANRRPLRSRQTGWAQTLATLLARRRISPDSISAASLVFAALGCAALMLWPSQTGLARVAILLAAAVLIQLRLLANLLDGLVAVEHGLGRTAGPIWNELPDRIADVLFFLGAGYGARFAGVGWAADLGWLTAVLALLAPYVRELGRGLGMAADFSGPGAKPHRMTALTLTCALSAAAAISWATAPGLIMSAGLAVISALTATTIVRRTLHLARWLAARSET